ncbi:Gfo/Idh/MocA family protein [Pseudoalteromonas prydzensis]|uniref:Gfo/Idh/MocA family protein n=1 Tax=Pseudoalteromonas prydzensis TaxID=182141 RepID=UPI00370471BB
MSISVAIAGFGKMGKIRAKTILDNKDTELVAIYEQNDEYICNDNLASLSVESFEDLLAANPDAIFICAFNHVAADYTIRALQKGIHVFCEKPPAKNTTELMQVLAAEESAKTVLKYGFNHRLHYSVSEAKKIIDSGRMGKLLWLRGVYGKAGSIDYQDNWRNFKNYSGGGILMDQGIHMLDLYNYLSGLNFEVVSATLQNSFWPVGVEDNAFVLLQSDSVMASMHSSATQWKHKFLLEMCFENGFVNLDGILSDSRSYAPETLVVAKREFEDVTFAMGKPAENVTWFENDDSWKLELAEFVAAVKGEEKIGHGTSEDAYKVLDLVERIYAKSGFYD